jgi:hypothetical protein
MKPLTPSLTWYPLPGPQVQRGQSRNCRAAVVSTRGGFRDRPTAAASPEAIAAKQVEMRKFAEMYRNPLINSAMTFMETLPVALVVSLVTAGVLSRRKKVQPGPATR